MNEQGEPRPFVVEAAGPLKGTACVPGDKSISHRSLILGAMTVGETRVTGLLEGEDVLDTARAMQSFGADIGRDDDGVWRIIGVGVGGFSEPSDIIDCGNSGTGVRLIMGSMATTPITATFTGDLSLRSRPMDRVTTPLRAFGAQTCGRSGGRLPITLVGSARPNPIDYTLPIPSAQVKSAILLAGLNAPGETRVREPEPTRDHTERMLVSFGAELDIEDEDGTRIIHLKGFPELRPRRVVVPSDPSSAAFPICAALIVEGSEILVPNVGLNPTRAGLFETLIEMGADLVFENNRTESGEPVADLRARHSPNMRGVDVPPERAASMIDEFPILSVVAAFAEGTTVMNGVKELRVKESDRIDAMAVGLRENGVMVVESEDRMSVAGRGAGGVSGGGTVATRLDHRIAMSFFCLGLGSAKGVRIDDARPISTSFPDFISLMRRLGVDTREPESKHSEATWG